MDITLKIDEGSTTHIKEIDFEGNQHFSNRTLRHQMQMDRHGMLSWLSKDDRFSDEKFRQDLQAITVKSDRDNTRTEDVNSYTTSAMRTTTVPTGTTRTAATTAATTTPPTPLPAACA